VAYRVRYVSPEGRERSQTFKRQIDAQKFRTSVEHSLLIGGYVDPRAGRAPFKAYAEEWRKRQVHRGGTTTAAEQHLRLHIYPSLGDRPIGSIYPSDIQALVQRLSQKLAPSTVEVVYGRVVAVFRAAIRDRVLVTTPCEGIKLPTRKPPSALTPLSTEQVIAIADSVHPHYRSLVIVGAGTGLRTGELFGLTESRIDFLRRTLRVDQQLVRHKPNRLVLADPKTNASHRTIPLPDLVLDTLAAHLSERKRQHEWGLVFTTTKGGPIQEHTFTSAWATARSKVGVPTSATPKHLRHYYASLLIRSGASVKVVQARLGHSSVKTTLDIYGHLFADEEDRTRAVIDSEFDSMTAWRRPEGENQTRCATEGPGQITRSA
jgi:integrase